MYSVTVGPCVIKAFRLKEEYINAKTDMLTCDWNPNIMQMKNQNVSVSVSLFNRGRDETSTPCSHFAWYGWLPTNEDK